MKKMMTIDHVYIREGAPSTSAPKKGIIYKGFSVQVQDKSVTGNAVDGTDQWYTDGNGAYFWAGAFQGSAISPQPGNSEIDDSGPSPEPAGSNTADADAAWHLADYGIPALWAKTKGEGISVGVLDSGVMQNHNELSGAVLSSTDFTSSDRTDFSGHGTMCSGLIAGRNTLEKVGIAPAAKILIYKVTHEDLGYNGGKYLLLALKALNANTSKGLRILNMSLSFREEVPGIQVELTKLHAKGIVIVASAGNRFISPGTPIRFPATCREVISVAGITSDEKPDGVSTQIAGIDILAPGKNVATLSNNRVNTFQLATGSSVACAFVSGVIALMLAKENLTPDQVKDRLIKTGKVSGSATFGNKIIQPTKLL
jgi:subtilisin family serine protease